MPRRKKQPKEPKEVKTTIRGKKNVVQTVVVKVGETKAKRRGRRRRSAPKPDVMMRELPPPVIYQTGPAQIPAPMPPPAPNVPPAFAAEAQAQQLGVGLARPVSRDIPFVELVEAVPTVSEKKGMKAADILGGQRERLKDRELEQQGKILKERFINLAKTLEQPMEEAFPMVSEKRPVVLGRTPFKNEEPINITDNMAQLSFAHPSTVENNIGVGIEPKDVARTPVPPSTPRTPTEKPKGKRVKLRVPRDTDLPPQFLQNLDEPTSPRMMKFETPNKL